MAPVAGHWVHWVHWVHWESTGFLALGCFDGGKHDQWMEGISKKHQWYFEKKDRNERPTHYIYRIGSDKGRSHLTQ